jgi:hypothetical protein
MKRGVWQLVCEERIGVVDGCGETDNPEVDSVKGVKG